MIPNDVFTDDDFIDPIGDGLIEFLEDPALPPMQIRFLVPGTPHDPSAGWGGRACLCRACTETRCEEHARKKRGANAAR